MTMKWQTFLPLVRAVTSQRSVLFLTAAFILVFAPACNQRETLEAEPSTVTVGNGPIELEVLNNTLQSEMSEARLVRTLGRPSFEHIVGDSQYYLYDRRIEGAMASSNEVVVGFRVLVSNDFVRSWQLSVLDSSLPTNQLFFSDSSAVIEAAAKLVVPPVPVLKLYLEPETLRFTWLKFFDTENRPQAVAEFQPVSAVFVEDQNGIAGLKVVLSPSDQGTLKVLTQEHRGSVLLVSLGERPVSRVSIRETIDYDTVVLPLNF
jgi:hypothetical protein